MTSGCANTAYVMASKDGFEAERKGDLAAAEASFKKAVLACGQADTSTNAVDGWTNLAKIYFAEKKYDLAAITIERVSTLWPRFPNKAAENKTVILNMLGQSYQELQKYDKAEAVLKEALNAAQNQSGDNGPNIAKVLISLGSLYKTQSKWDKALDSYQRGQAILERSANISPETRDTLQNNIDSVADHVHHQKKARH